MKNTLLSLIFLIIVSCSNDDDNECGCRPFDGSPNPSLLVGCPGEEEIIPDTPEAIAEFCN